MAVAGGKFRTRSFYGWMGWTWNRGGGLLCAVDDALMILET